MTVFLRLLDTTVDEKPQSLSRAVAALHGLAAADKALGRVIFEQDPAAFSAVPGSPFAYWVSDEIRALFNLLPPFEARRGLGTDDDFRFLRLWFETKMRPESKWVPLAKGGVFARFYADLSLTLNWDARGRELRALVIQRWGNEGKRIYNESYYLRPGLTWSPRTQSGLGMRVLPAGVVIGSKGPAIYVESDDPSRLLATLAITTCAAYSALVAMQMAFGSYEVGVIQRTPIPDLSPADIRFLAQLSQRAWVMSRSLDTTNETSHAFLLPPGLNEKLTALDGAFVERELATIQREIDEAAYTLYGISPEDRVAIEVPPKQAVETNTAEDEEMDDGGEADGDEAPVAVAADALISWSVGVAFGRFDPRLASAERSVPSEPEPFDRLPSRSPGMWPEGEVPARRPVILVDDEGHPDDLVAIIRVVTEHVRVDVQENLRLWLANEFFSLHIRMYSGSRRKAPIYWQLAIPSAKYSVWLYIQAFTKDTLFRVQNDYAAPKLAHEERRLDLLKSDLGIGGIIPQRKEIAAQEAFVEELRGFLEELRRVAPLWNPNLDDGVIINFAPLWRLTPQHKAWQKELKATWDSLCAGAYDWAHLAMHLWPQRVVPKCATDRSLAIAHVLEDAFWVEGEDGKWKPRKTPTRPISELVAERSSEAVKAALRSLLEAPEPSGSTKRGRKSQSRLRTA